MQGCNFIDKHNDTQHNDTQHNAAQHNAAQHNDTQYNDIQRNDTQYLTNKQEHLFLEIIFRLA